MVTNVFFRRIMREYAESLGDKDNKADGEKQNIMHMVNQI